jgi:3-oxoacyl-[acyl-carrier protein] reductase
MNAIVTAATKGMGRSIALKLAQSGYNLAVCARNEEELAAFVRELSSYGVKAIGLATDCGVKEEVYRFAEFVSAEFTSIDVLVNNAGIFLMGSMLDEADDVFEKQQNINLNCAYYLSKYVGKMMRNQHSGHIFNICSIAAKEAVPNAGSYTVTKSALYSLNTVLRQELSKYHVKVTAVLPGSTLTASWQGTDIPTEKFVQPEDIADTIANILKLSAGANVDEVILKPLNF